MSHLSFDLCRENLEFAEGRPLGKSGLHWLKIHLANLYGGGIEKLSYDGRLSFVENHLGDIFDSAHKPLNGNQWWLNAEDPFQCLSACINLSEALKSPSPYTVVSHLPIHQVYTLYPVSFLSFENFPDIGKKFKCVFGVTVLRFHDICSLYLFLIDLIVFLILGWLMQWLTALCSSWERQCMLCLLTITLSCPDDHSSKCCVSSFIYYWG